MTQTLQIHDLATGFGTTFVLGGVSLEAPGGSVVGLIGPNGSGKCTLLKAIAGVRPLRHGSVLLGGKPHRSQPLAVAFVPQR
ncbi:MAG: ATP-binding cassette domain-containing protein, partial [Dehalococcoidia bacterium]